MQIGPDFVDVTYFVILDYFFKNDLYPGRHSAHDTYIPVAGTPDNQLKFIARKGKE